MASLILTEYERQRFEAKVRRAEPGECAIWTAARTNGYGHDEGEN